MFFPGSRYAAMATYQVNRPNGTTAQVVKVPLPGPATVLGYHRRLSGQRLDMIAAHYLTDATAFWRLCDANNTMVPDALGAAGLVGIPPGAPVTS
jgi:hypothetical protein